MDIRNIAIIAHVDHGKTTLVNNLLKQCGVFRSNQVIQERVLDSNVLERERGITIFSKCVSVLWGEVQINIIDTPGHADFGGEVERVLSMVDGVVVLVDAVEGPQPQTKFVVGKALALKLRPIVIINKVDRSDAKPYLVHNAIFDLFVALNADEAQLDFPTLYASSREGWAVADLEQETRQDLTPLLKLIIHHIPPPLCDKIAPFTMLVTTLEYDVSLGRILTGRIHTGRVYLNMPIKVLNHEGLLLEQARAVRLLSFQGLHRVSVETAMAGEIVTIVGLEKATVADSLCALEVTTPLPSIPVDPPTLAVTFSVNDSPLAGQDGDKVTSRAIAARLKRETESNIAIRMTENGDSFEVSGRGELQLGVFIETMRREGFELSISRPRVLLATDTGGLPYEPVEEVTIDIDTTFIGVVVEKMSRRKADLVSVRSSGSERSLLIFYAPSRGLIGYHGEFLIDTRGTGIIHRLYHGHTSYRGPIESRRSGVLISTESGIAAAYALYNLEERGILFIDPGTKVYPGMIIGEHSRNHDLEVNPLRSKQLTNFRTTGKNGVMRLVPPHRMTVEAALAYITDDELIEVTPRNIRLRKKYPSLHERSRIHR